MPNATLRESTDSLPAGLQAALNLIDQGFSLFDEALRLMAWNRPFLDLLGLPEQGVHPGDSLESLIRFGTARAGCGADHEAAPVEALLDAARRFEAHACEIRRPDGRLIGTRGVPLPGQGFLILHTDLTRQRQCEALIRQQNSDLEAHVRHRTEALEASNARLTEANAANTLITSALKRSEARLRLITDKIPALIGYFDANKIFRYANKGYSDWFGLRNEDIVDHGIREVLGQQVYASVAGPVRRALSGEQVSYEYSREGPDGQRQYARSILVPEFGADGLVLGCFVLSFDVSEEKHAREALAQAQKMQAIGQLAGGLAHDFNNLLTVVLGNLGALADRQSGQPDMAEFVEPATQAARRGVELVKRLLTFSRQQPLEAQPVDVVPLVQDLGRLIRRSLPASISFSIDAERARLVTMADSCQLENALLNLVFNARDALPNGGEIRVVSSLVTLDAHAAADLELPAGDYVQLAVSDNGMGMDGSVLAHVFEPFFTTKAFGRGNGLGLSMVYGLAGQLGGGVRIRSRQARGTTVALLLPLLAEQPGQADEGASPAGDLVAHGRLVLLVDDDPEVRKVVRLLLIDLGYAVLEAENGTEAAAILETVGDIAILLSDVVMPGGLDGHALALLARQRRPELEIILMSGYAAGESPDIPGVPLLAKPFSRTDLVRLLRACPI